jgi:hypothetical protein
MDLARQNLYEYHLISNQRENNLVFRIACIYERKADLLLRILREDLAIASTKLALNCNSTASVGRVDP